MRISIEEMRRLAARSRLALGEEELARYADELAELERLSGALLTFEGARESDAECLTLSELRPDRVGKRTPIGRDFSVPRVLGEVES